MALYAELAGAAWETLPPVIRRLHDVGRARGRFDVVRGPGLATRLLAGLFRLPPPGTGVVVELEVADDARGQRWRRSFGGAPLVSRQFRDGAELVERLGPVECTLRLAADDGRLRMTSTRAGLRVGGWRCPLPRALGPHIAATVAAEGAGARVEVEIRVGGALLMRYTGHAEPVVA